MKRESCLFVLLTLSFSSSAQVRFSSWSQEGAFTLSEVFTNGAASLWQAESVDGPWRAQAGLITTARTAQVSLAVTGAAGFYRAQALDFSGGRAGFTNLTRAYGLLTTIAGAGGAKDVNNWRPEFEGGPATNALLSGPHIAIADRAGQVYIADKDAHAIRKICLDDSIVTVAGTNAPGNGPDEETLATQCGLNQPNGLWVKRDGTVFILDMGNHKVRRLATDGTLRTLFQVASTDLIQRGLWVSEDEQLAYVTTFTAVKKWTPDQGATDFSTGYTEMGNIAMDPGGSLVVTDRGTHSVYRLDPEGTRTLIAGNGTTLGGGDGQPALETGLEEVRGVWFLPTGAYFLCTHRSSRVWYVDVAGDIHLFLHGFRNSAHAGDGTWFYEPSEARVSKCRAVTMDWQGNVLITENDAGFVRKVRLLPCEP